MKNTISIILLLVTFVLTTHGQDISSLSRSNIVKSLVLDDIWKLRFGLWIFGEPGYFWPLPVVLKAEAYLDEAADSEDGQTILTELMNLEHENVFIPMCGDFAHIGILNTKDEWLAFISLNADGKTVIISDHAVYPTNWVVASSPTLCSNVFRVMWEYNPEIVRQRMKDNCVIKSGYMEIFNHLESSREMTTSEDVQHEPPEGRGAAPRP